MRVEQPWSDKDVKRLVSLRTQDGFSLNKISEMMCRSRGSIAGKMMRLHLCSKDGRNKRTRVYKYPTPNEIEKKELEKFWQPILSAKPVSLLDLEDSHCRWPIDRKCEYGLVMYCGADRLDGHSYCAAHSLIKVKI